jgi:hypothetical protein
MAMERLLLFATVALIMLTRDAIIVSSIVFVNVTVIVHNKVIKLWAKQFTLNPFFVNKVFLIYLIKTPVTLKMSQKNMVKSFFA